MWLGSSLSWNGLITIEVQIAVERTGDCIVERLLLQEFPQVLGKKWTRPFHLLFVPVSEILFGAGL